jgi:hypothetical protein
VIEQQLDNHTVPPFLIQLAMAPMSADFLESQLAQQCATGGVLRKDPAYKLVHTCRRRRARREHPGRGNPALHSPTSCECNESYLLGFRNNDKVLCGEPFCNLDGRTPFGLEGGDAVGDALVAVASGYSPVS